MARTRLLLAALLPLLAGQALGATSLLSDEILLVRAIVDRNVIALPVSNLTSPDPLNGWFGAGIVPATLDSGADVDPDLAVFPGEDDRRIVMVWAKENAETSSLDIAAAFFRVPYLPKADEILWLTRTPGDEASPKVAVDPQGRVHVVWMGGDGAPEYRVLSERGRILWSQSALDLPDGVVQGIGITVDPDGRTWVAVGVDGPDDVVVVLSEGNPDEDKPPSGGEIILEPLRLDHREAQVVAAAPGSASLQPRMETFMGVPIVLWRTQDQSLGVPMLHFRYRLEGSWRPDPSVEGNARIPLAAGLTEGDAVSAVRELIRSVLAVMESSAGEPPDLDPGLSGGGLAGRTLR